MVFGGRENERQKRIYFRLGNAHFWIDPASCHFVLTRTGQDAFFGAGWAVVNRPICVVKGVILGGRGRTASDLESAGKIDRYAW